MTEKSLAPSILFEDKHAEDFVDDDDDCIICGKLLLKHDEYDADQCYNTLIRLRKLKRGEKVTISGHE